MATRFRGDTEFILWIVAILATGTVVYGFGAMVWKLVRSFV